jgi:hypothetical protein
MTKASAKYLLSLFILLLSVYGNLYAHTNQECNCYSSKRTLVGSEQASFGALHNNQAQFIKATLSVTENENCKIVAAEIEEEKHEWISFKKYLAYSNYFTTVFYALAFGYFCYLLKKRLPSCKHSIYFSSCKWYLRFRVIRIWFNTPKWLANKI